MKKLLKIVLAVVLIGALTLLYVNGAKNKQTPNEATPQIADNSAASENNDPTAHGAYVIYSETELAEVTGEKYLFFHASWCPQCRSIEADILEQGIPEGITIFKVDYDSNQALRKKYGVTIQTTFVKLDDAGNKLGSYVAYNEPTFDAVKRDFIK